MRSVTLSLVSHTNVGKTTLARTLLRRDVGEVLDQAHVTDVSEAHELLATEDGVLRLWDTPGFGDTARLLKRLRAEGNPLGWFLHQVWDRITDRPLWCGQEAVRNVKEEADVVLYLVNAAEDPGDAGYVDLELELLDWMERPVLILLNQTGAEVGSGPGATNGDGNGGRNHPASADALARRWEEATSKWPAVRGVVPLDAFTRCWVEEGLLLRRVAEILEGEQQDTMRALTTAWEDRHLAVFEQGVDLIAAHLAEIAGDAEPLGGGRLDLGAKKRAMGALAERLDTSTARLMTDLIAAHGLDGTSQQALEQSLEDFQVSGSPALDEGRSALLGGLLSGAVGGVAADILAGGMTFFGGALVGAALGALGGYGLAAGFRLVSSDEEPVVRWSPEFLDALAERALLLYLSVAHFGRGRGGYKDIEQPAVWRRRVDEAVAEVDKHLDRCWSEAEERDAAATAAAVVPLLDAAIRKVLAAGYPQAADVLGRRSG